MTAPTITALPTAPTRSDPANFNTNAEAFVAALATFQSEMNSFGTYINSAGIAAEEHGTWTPVLSDAISAGNNATITVDGANYAKWGRLVNLNFSILNIDTTGMTAGNTLYILGLPFANSSGSLSSNASRGPVSVTNTTYGSSPVLRTTNGTSHIRISSAVTAGGLTSLTVGDLTSGTSDIWGSITYLTLD